MLFLPVQCSFPWACLNSRGYICKQWEGGQGKNWPVPTNPKELQTFLGLAYYYHHFIQKFTAITKCLNQLVGPVNHQKTKKNKKVSESKADPKSD